MHSVLTDLHTVLDGLCSVVQATAPISCWALEWGYFSRICSFGNPSTIGRIRWKCILIRAWLFSFPFPFSNSIRSWREKNRIRNQDWSFFKFFQNAQTRLQSGHKKKRARETGIIMPGFWQSGQTRTESGQAIKKEQHYAPFLAIAKTGGSIWYSNIHYLLKFFTTSS